MNLSIPTHSLDATQALARAIGAVLKGGEVFELLSDVGGGKTSFTKGLAKGLGIDEVVQSPTFTISRLYKGRDNLELHHFDFYRLTEAGVVAAELNESLHQPNAIVVVEWGEIAHDVLPAQRSKITIKSLDETSRVLSFELDAAHDYIAKAIHTYKEQRNLA